MKEPFKIITACLAASLLIAAAAKPHVVHPKPHAPPPVKPVALPPPDGWGPYKFGMTPEQVQGVPGIHWRDLKKNMLLGRPLYQLDTGDSLSVDGRSYQPTIMFDENKKLGGVFLAALEDGGSRECENGLQQLVRKFEPQYGAFEPSAAQGNKLGRLTQWRNISALRSKYSVVTAPDAPNRPPRFETLREFNDAAKTTIDLGADVENGKCRLRIEMLQG